MEMPDARHKAALKPGPFQTIRLGKRPDLHAAGVVFLLIFLGLGLRLARLSFQPLWWDEGYSVWFATHPLTQMAALTAQDIHPPLYYALLHGWAAPLGTSPAALRLLSVAVGVLTIPLLYLVARRMLSTRGALLATFLLMINPLHIYYSQEVRMYGLVALLSVGILAAAWPVFEQRRGGVQREELRGKAAEEQRRGKVSPPPRLPHFNTSARLYLLVHRRALYSILRHLPAHRPDDLCGLALAT